LEIDDLKAEKVKGCIKCHSANTVND
jgi:hypothetical protein